MRLFSLAVLLTFVLGAVGTLGAVSRRNAGVRTVGAQSEPLIVDAQAIDTSLAQADATAANAFLGGGIEAADQRAQYLGSIANATRLLTDASQRGGTSVDVQRPLRDLSSQLAVYTGLVETARSNNRQGYPIGAAYLRQANLLMTRTVLPAAQQLYDVYLARLKGGDRRARSAHDTALVGFLLILVLGAGGGSLVWLYRRTNRLVNLPLAIAAALAAVLLAVVVIDLRSEAAQAGAARDTSFATVNLLAQARIAAFSAKADESLTLIARGNGQSFDASFNSESANMVTLVQQAQSAGAGTAVQAYLSVHKKIRNLDDGGQFDQAVKLAVGGGSASAANQAFTTLDRTLSAELDTNQAAFVSHIGAARNHLRALTPAVVIVMLAAVLLALFGFQQRINEYR